jgi:hypothetical protein
LSINCRGESHACELYSGCAPSRVQKALNQKSKNKFTRVSVQSYSGHAPGHVRDAFLTAFEVLDEWHGTGREPLVDFEINYEPVQITIGQACYLVSGCTDILPGGIRDQLEDFGLKMGTYSAGAKAMHRWLAEKKLPLSV